MTISQEEYNKLYLEQYGSHPPVVNNTPAPTESENNLKQLEAQSDSGKEEAEIAALPPDQQKFVRDNQGIGGSLRVGAESFGNQALFGLPEMAYEKFADPNDVAQHEALKHFHQTANVVGGIGGAAASLAIGGPIFDAASGVGKAAEAAVIGGREAEQVSLARTIASKIVGGATEGAVVGAPKTIGNAALGDPKEAAENLVMSAGLGGLLGPTTFGLGKAISGASKVGSEIAGKTGEKIEGLFQDQDPLLAHFGLDNSNMAGARLTETGMKEVKSFLGGAVKKNLELGGLGYGGPLGYIKGKLAGTLAKEAVDRIPEEYLTTGLQATLKASNFAEKQLSQIPDILSNLSSSSFGKAANSAPVVFGEGIKDLSNAKDDYEKFSKLGDKLAQDQASGNHITTIGNNSSLLSHNPDIQQAYQETSLNAVNYLNTIIPKNQNAPQMFSKNDTWKPTSGQLQQFKNQVDLISNPYTILDKLRNGTVTSQDVTTLKAVYPAIYSKIQSEILKHGTDPKYSNLSFAAKNKINLLIGANGMSATNINALQNSFTLAKQPNPGGSSKKALSAMPSLSTENQDLSYGKT